MGGDAREYEDCQVCGQFDNIPPRGMFSPIPCTPLFTILYPLGLPDATPTTDS